MSEPRPQLSEKEIRERASLVFGCDPREICTNCGGKIEVMAFRNTGVCCEICRKDRDGDHSRNHAIIEAPQGGER